MGVMDKLNRLDEKVGLGPSAEGIGRQLDEYPSAHQRWEQLDESGRVEAYLDAVVRSKPPPNDRDISLWLALLEVGQRPIHVILWMDVALLLATGIMLAFSVDSGIVNSALTFSVVGVAIAATQLHQHSKKRRALLRQLPEAWPRSPETPE